MKNNRKAVVIGKSAIGERYVRVMTGWGWKVDNPREMAGMSWGSRPWHDYCLAVVASPTHLHVRDCALLTGMGVPFIVEKPLSHSMGGVGELVRRVENAHLPTMVGCPMRYTAPAMYLASTRHIYPRRSLRIVVCESYVGYWPRYRRSKELGGGALLELIHEIDLAQYLQGEVKEIKGELYGEVETDSVFDAGVERKATLELCVEDGNSVKVLLDIYSKGPLLRRMVTSDCQYFDYGMVSDTVERMLFDFVRMIESGGEYRCGNSVREAAQLLGKVIRFRDSSPLLTL